MQTESYAAPEYEAYRDAADWHAVTMAFVEEPPPLGAGALGEAVRVHWAAVREPQSAQSVPQVHAVYSEPAPPSSQSPSLAAEHVFDGQRRRLR